MRTEYIFHGVLLGEVNGACAVVDLNEFIQAGSDAVVFFYTMGDDGDEQCTSVRKGDIEFTSVTERLLRCQESGTTGAARGIAFLRGST